MNCTSCSHYNPEGSKFCNECGQNLQVISQDLFFDPLNKLAPESLFKMFIRKYKKNELIFKEGSYGNEMFVVKKGKIKLFTNSEKNEVFIRTCTVGDIFGEMALVDDTPRSASASALEDDTQLIVIDHNKFLYLVNQQPPFALTIMHVLSERLR